MDIIPVLIQIPILAVFIWFTDRLLYSFKKERSEDRQEFITAIKELKISNEVLNKTFESHKMLSINHWSRECNLLEDIKKDLSK